MVLAAAAEAAEIERRVAYKFWISAANYPDEQGHHGQETRRFAQAIWQKEKQ